MQIFDQNSTLMIVNFSFFYDFSNATAPTLMQYFCLIRTFGIYFLHNSEIHRIDDEKIWTTAIFYVLIIYYYYLSSVKKKLYIMADISGGP